MASTWRIAAPHGLVHAPTPAPRYVLEPIPVQIVESPTAASLSPLPQTPLMLTVVPLADVDQSLPSKPQDRPDEIDRPDVTGGAPPDGVEILGRGPRSRPTQGRSHRSAGSSLCRRPRRHLDRLAQHAVERLVQPFIAEDQRLPFQCRMVPALPTAHMSSSRSTPTAVRWVNSRRPSGIRDGTVPVQGRPGKRH